MLVNYVLSQFNRPLQNAATMPLKNSLGDGKNEQFAYHELLSLLPMSGPQVSLLIRRIVDTESITPVSSPLLINRNGIIYLQNVSDYFAHGWYSYAIWTWANSMGSGEYVEWPRRIWANNSYVSTQQFCYGYNKTNINQNQRIFIEIFWIQFGIPVSDNSRIVWKICNHLTYVQSRFVLHVG